MIYFKNTLYILKGAEDVMAEQASWRVQEFETHFDQVVAKCRVSYLS